MGTKGFTYHDELGMRRSLFTNGSVQEIVNNNRKVEDYELVLIGALLGYIDSVLKSSHNNDSVDIDKFQHFPELNLAVLISQSWDLFNPDHLKIILLLSQLFDKNAKRFRENPGVILTKRAEKIIMHRLQNFTSTR